jgi:hypothetical protein
MNAMTGMAGGIVTAAWESLDAVLAAERHVHTNVRWAPNTLLLLLAAAFVVILIIRRASSNRDPRRGGTGAFQCPNCGGGNPAFAQFCRRCGRRI